MCCGAGARNISHLRWLALDVVELVPALAQPGQAGAVLLAQGLQLGTQLLALQGDVSGGVSGSEPHGARHTETGRAPAAAVALRLCTGSLVMGEFHFCHLCAHIYLHRTEQISGLHGDAGCALLIPIL